MDQRKKVKIILVIIGIFLIFSVISGIYRINVSVKNYETADAICIGEIKSYDEGATTYQREYKYIVSGQKYVLTSYEVKGSPYKIIKYNPNNPNEAQVYESISISSIIILGTGLILVCSPFILNIINDKKICEIKYKFLIMSKRNIIKIITICFWGIMLFSLIVTLNEIIFEPDWGNVLNQYSKTEIILECSIYLVARCNFKESKTYFNIFRT